jgi:HSP20 family molecular chaperone IbpA
MLEKHRSTQHSSKPVLQAMKVMASRLLSKWYTSLPLGHVGFLPWDCRETPDTLVLAIALQGLSAEDFQLTVEPEAVWLEATVQQHFPWRQGSVAYHSVFRQRLPLPQRVRTDQYLSHLEPGRLVVTLHRQAPASGLGRLKSLDVSSLGQKLKCAGWQVKQSLGRWLRACSDCLLAD